MILKDINLLVKPYQYFSKDIKFFPPVNDTGHVFSINYEKLFSNRFFIKQIKFPGVYIIRNNRDGIFYIGSTSDVYERIHKHCYYLRSGIHRSELLQNSFNNSSKSDFEVVYFPTHDREYCFDLEQYLLDHFNGNKNFANKAKNARVSALGATMPVQLKEKLLSLNTGRKQTKEHIFKRVIHLRNRKMSPEAIEKIRKWNKNKVLSLETRNKISQANRGKKLSPEALKRKIQNSRVSKSYQKGLIAARAAWKIPVTVNGQRFESVKEAAKYLKINPNTLKYRLKVSKLPGYEYVKTK